MSHQDEVYIKVFGWVIGGLVIFTIAIIILANSVGQLEQEAVFPEAKGPEALLARIAPVGKVRVAGAEPETTPVAARSGEEVVDAACASCHANGIAGSPKLGDKEAWSARAAQGFDTLLSNAVNGIRGMPARGGNPSITNEEMHKAVAYMLEQAGVEAEPAAEEAGSSEPATAGTEPAAAPETATAAGNAGKEIYESACMACHAAGIAGAPTLGDQAAWADRIAQGMTVLGQNAIQGIRGMPPKGGRMDLDDQAVLDAVAYMVEQSQ